MENTRLLSLFPRMPSEVPADRLLASNLAALSACDLDLARRVAAAKPDALPAGVIVRPAASGAPTVSAGALLLHSAHDPAAEAALQAGAVDPAADRVMVLGLGAGHLIAALLQHPQVRRVDVVPLSASVLRGVAMRIDFKPLLCDPRVRFVPDDALRLAPAFACVPPMLKLAEPRCQPLRDAAVSALAGRPLPATPWPALAGEVWTIASGLRLGQDGPALAALTAFRARSAPALADTARQAGQLQLAQEVPALLQAAAECQERGDLIGLADVLEHRLLPGLLVLQQAPPRA